MRALPVFAALLLAACAGPEPVSESPYLDARDGVPLDGFEAVAARAAEADLIVVGEIHDNPAHQAFQARLAERLDIEAVALEMIPRAAETSLAELRAGAGDDPALRDAAQWNRYAPYHVVLAAVPDAAIIGAGVSREDLRLAMTDGPAAAFDGDAARWGLDSPLPDETQAEMEAEMMRSHCDALPEEMLPGMVSAQRLRDAAFAEALLRAKAVSGEGPAMLVVGNGHARRDRGVPAYLAKAAPGLDVLVIGQEEGAPGSTPAAEAPPLYDLVAVAEPAAREDPCAAFLESRAAAGG